MVGIGMSMEGIEQNPVAHDIMSEMAFQHNKVDVKDKNRDVIVAVPNLDPFFISVRQKSHCHNCKPVSRSTILKENPDSYDHPHLWYSTSEVLRALEFFIASGEELSGSNPSRLAF
ncbi:alpha-N-acetylglucosaminidase-like [Hevea brasiliensis]|uniref:alpha-N-acetylglucosaminidase-like n=1 Tax=Hevea brasiliensis TaxID=3981 RepID=UPI0025E9290B|nr:alpha-N-acetylglucosaminidase-like [Hevea brasiliensis]